MYKNKEKSKPKKKAPAGFHYMPDGTLMKDSKMPKSKPKSKPKKTKKKK